MLYSYSDAFSFSLPSDVTTHSQMIAAPIFSTNASVIFSITACVSITEQCESSFVGDTVCGRYSAGAQGFIAFYLFTQESQLFM